MERKTNIKECKERKEARRDFRRFVHMAVN